MRDLKWLLGAILVAGLCFAANASTNPDPFNVKRAPVVASPAPVVVQAQPAPAPAAVAPSWFDGLQNWVNTALLTLLTGLVGKGAFWPARTPVVAASDAPTEPTTASGLLKSIKDPSLRAKADEAILTVIRSGIPGAGIQSGLSMVPGVGPLLAQAEPLLRQAADRIVAERMAQNLSRTP